MPGTGVSPLERQCEINDDIIRKLILKVDARIADALVQHALAGNEVAATKRPGPVPGPTAAPAAAE